jgi:AGCS family alanine or glycine:cation symporter
VDIQLLVNKLGDLLVNWPLIIFVIGVAVLCTISLRFIQVRYFFFAWKQIFAPAKTETPSTGKVDMTPVQAFINTLSTNLGNGAIAGVATAIFSGGPGAALWIVIFGLLLMSVRFAEVFLSLYYASHPGSSSSRLGGPMLYLSFVPFGAALTWIYAILCCLFGFIGGSSIQTNSITLSLVTSAQTTLQSNPSLFFLAWITPMTCAIALTLFTFYVVFGGASRIVKLNDAIVPVKVIVFFSTTLIILFYHRNEIVSALSLICKSAFSPVAFMGGALGFSVLQAIRFGMIRTIFSTESGLGTAAILFGHTGSKTPVKDGIMSMLSTFISMVVCFIVALCIIASGAYLTPGLTSTALTGASFKTVFGNSGTWVVTFLSTTFGIGVLVGYAYITREVWFFLTQGRFAMAFSILYCLFAFGGAMLDVTVIWNSSNIFLAIMLLINLFGVFYLLPVIKKSFDEFEKHSK